MSRKRRTRAPKWRPIVDGHKSGRYAAWVRQLRGKNGAYLLRDSETHEILYAGESHSEQLYETLTRHFQKWHGRTAGVTLPREWVEARVKVTRLGRSAVKVQNAWILRFDPVHNVQGKAARDDLAPDSTPF